MKYDSAFFGGMGLGVCLASENVWLRLFGGVLAFGSVVALIVGLEIERRRNK